MKISHKKRFNGKIHDFSSELNSGCSANNILADSGYWSTAWKDRPENEYVIIDYRDNIVIDRIEIEPSVNGADAFPKSFRIEFSMDGKTWKVIHNEYNIDLGHESYSLDIPLNRLRYLKILITENNCVNSKYYSEIGRCNAEISGYLSIRSSSSMENSKPENLFDPDPGISWESENKTKKASEYLNIDLGKIAHINRIVLGASEYGFPERFSIDTSTDNNVWIRLFDEKDFKAENNNKYYWDFDITPARYIRFEMVNMERGDGNYSVKLSGIEIFSAVSNPSHIHNMGDLVPYSSVFQAGIVRLAGDGDDSPAAAVQGSDRRLKDATTIFKGIVQLAEDGEESEGLVVQASDKRLKAATELKPGIVRLGYDRENKQGIAVQGNDSRLQEATEKSYGIVKLCPNGLETEHGVVVGNDSRLKKATEESYGICRLAGDGDNSSGSVVQANDKRLREATTGYKGIVELAEDGEDKPGVAVQGNDRRLKDATISSKGIVELAEDGEDRDGVVVQGSDRRLKDATISSKGIVELAEDGEDKPGVAVQGNDRRLKDATVNSKGIVELAEDGEERPGVAVQGNDRRLKDATETFKGIMKFAGDGEDTPFTAVQGSDKRLKEATTLFKGIVELAEDGEDRDGVVVQGNDRRLKDATVNSKGIVELAEDGEDRPGVVVQGNDRRLKDATVTGKGILRFASDGEVSSMAAVQGSDRRLKDATTTSKGIVELAEDGEENEGVAVQGNDRRLREATVSYKGIVELAEDGEDRDGVVVQGSDRRLKYADEEHAGIVKFAKNCETKGGIAVQANDSRLSDAREPLSHSHDYAPVNHEFNCHSGTISLKDRKDELFTDIVTPPDNSAIIHAVNESADKGSAGIVGAAGISGENIEQSYGVLGHSAYIGIRGQSSGNPGGEISKGCGVLGISRFGAGGVFASEHNYSIIADGFGRINDYDNSVNLIGNGDALFVNGKSEFNGKIHINNVKEKKGFPVNIVELFEIDDEEYVSSGDLLVVNENGGSILSHSRTEYNRAVIGVVSGNPTVIINNAGTEKKVYPVALAGKVLCKVDARNRPVKPGDLIVTSNTPGCGMAGVIDSFDKIGTVVGKALDSLEDGIGIIPLFLLSQ